MRDEHRHDQLVEELRLLLEAAMSRAEQHLGDRAAPDDARACCRCPFCAAMTLLRGQRGDVAEQLMSLVRSLRQALTDHESGGSPAAHEEDDVPEPPKVERIQVQRVDGPVLSEQDAPC